ncbi:DivIVA domain-containing protein [Dietzia psychralcaliphila]|uniref:DivIVA domain-containing protein n=1 Tax=Dietzia psychralcaliphila TaxID=139021 RepID=UPI001C1DF84C|nr:DivIVA domain-containing protein [Dietzia psychralcaliphila]
MLTVVIYVVITLIVAAALFALSIVVFGRSELLPAVARGHTVTTLPEGTFTGDDLRSVRFGMSARGYTMSEVDWALEEAAAEIDRLRARLAGDGNLGETSDEVGPERAPASGAGVTR